MFSLLALVFGKLKDIFVEKTAYWILSLFGFGAVASVEVGFLRDPFYHEGWLRSHRAWLPLLLVIAALSILACLSKGGAWVVGCLAVLCGIAFGILYESADFVSGGWPLITWLLHGILAALLIGFLAFVVDTIWQKLALTQRGSRKKSKEKSRKI